MTTEKTKATNEAPKDEVTLGPDGTEFRTREAWLVSRPGKPDAVYVQKTLGDLQRDAARLIDAYPDEPRIRALGAAAGMDEGEVERRLTEARERQSARPVAHDAAEAVADPCLPCALRAIVDANDDYSDAKGT